MFNALVGAERAIVTEVAGTTRDLVSEPLDVDGLAVTIVDTAGWRETSDPIEREGVARAARARDVADLLLVIVDRSAPPMREDDELLAQTGSHRRIVVGNKSDVAARGANVTRLCVSAKTGAGIDELRRAIVRELTGAEPLRDTAAISNARHIALVEEACGHLRAAQAAAARGDTPEEFVLVDLQAARARLEEIVGARTTEDVLRHIFERFCIGK